MATIRFEEKLKEHIEENGIQKVWFAKKIGVSSSFLHQMLGSKASPPKKCWKNLIVLTRGKITLGDILECCLRDSNFLSVRPGDKAITCEVCVKGMEGMRMN